MKKQQSPARFYDHDMERAYLKAILLGELAPDDDLSPSDFHDDVNCWVYAEMCQMDGVDYTLLAERLQQSRSAPDSVDMAILLSDLVDALSDLSKITQYAGSIKALASKRSLYLTLQGALTSMGSEAEIDVPSLTQTAIESLQGHLSRTSAIAEPYFPLEDLDTVCSAPGKEWLVDQVLGKQDLLMIYGPSGSGKTFIAINLAMMLVRGTGRLAGEFQVNRPANVVYMTAEGRSGLGQRFLAAVKSFGLTAEEQARCRVVRKVAQFVEAGSPSHYMTFLNDLRAQKFMPDVVIIDHLSSTVPGKGDSDQAAATLVAQAVAHIQDELDCAVVIIHHTGYDTSHSRGMTNYKDILDVQIKVLNQENPHRMTCDKNKDGPKWGARAFSIVPVAGTKSCTVEWGGKAKPKVDNRAIPKAKRWLADYIKEHKGVNQTTLKSEAHRAIGVGRDSVASALAELVTEKVVYTEKGKANNAKLYYPHL